MAFILTKQIADLNAFSERDSNTKNFHDELKLIEIEGWLITDRKILFLPGFDLTKLS